MWVVGNTALDGGGLSVQAKSALSATGGVRVVDNAASTDGGGVHVRDATLSFADGAQVSLSSTLSAGAPHS